jgi:hypothetical protein
MPSHSLIYGKKCLSSRQTLICNLAFVIMNAGVLLSFNALETHPPSCSGRSKELILCVKELRIACTLAEEAAEGGVSQRVSPLAQVSSPACLSMHPLTTRSPADLSYWCIPAPPLCIAEYTPKFYQLLSAQCDRM